MPTEEHGKVKEISETFIIAEQHGTEGAHPPKTLILLLVKVYPKIPVIPVTFPTMATRKNKKVLLVQVIPVISPTTTTRKYKKVLLMQVIPAIYPIITTRK